MLNKFILLAFLILPLSACFEKEPPAEDRYKVTIIREDGSEKEYRVELALTIDQQIQGLMHRTEMDDDAGMLFYFGDGEAERSFWMKNTLIPLDMIFIKADGTIHHIHEYAVPGDLTGVKSQGPVAAVLELNGGETLKSGIKVGNKVIHQLFSPNKPQ